MKLKKEDLIFEKGTQREWLITNGIGGYASSTVIGANTRRYHGLLIAPIAPPAKRKLILSKLDESIEIGDKKYDLYTNIGKSYISRGYQYLESFSKDILPVYEYKVEDIQITKTICMVYRRNIVQISYKIKNGNNKSKLILAPVINIRDFHSMCTSSKIPLNQDIEDGKVKIILNRHISVPIYMKTTEGIYEEHNDDMFYNMFYPEEKRRGFSAEENHAVCGTFTIDIEPNEEKEIGFTCSLENNIDELDPNQVIQEEIERQNKLYDDSLLIDKRKRKKTKKEIEKDELTKTFLTAIDNFIVYRPTFALHTTIAGYHWFLDWGRDTLISFEGLYLKSRRFEEAKEVLLTMTRDIKYGLIPNGYAEMDECPLYNSVDASLLLFEQVQKYMAYTEDYEFIKKSIYPKLKKIIQNYEQGITFSGNNIYLDEDGLIYSGSEKTQNTWMDAKNGDVIATPRYGKVVEINALWYNALKVMIDLTQQFGKVGKKIECKKYEEMAQKCKESFEKEFYNVKKKCLFDYIGSSKIRPNQLFALSLAYPVIDPTSNIARNIIDTVEQKLLNNYGLQTLAAEEKDYVDVYEGNGFKRDMSYHQGPTWPWLLGLYYDSLMNMQIAETNKTKKQELEDRIKELKKRTEKTFKKEIYERGCIGSISELYDSKTPFKPGGCVAQAWSVAEIFRIIFS